MLLERIASSFLEENCYVLAPREGVPALVVDPGAGTAERVRSLLAGHGLGVGGVLLTHGHPDHVWDCAEVSAIGRKPGEEAPVWLPDPDAYRMEDPARYVPGAREALAGHPWRAPARRVATPADSFEAAPAIWVRMVPAPGHTEGSALYLVLVEGAEGEPPFAFSGDVIFADSVGRTDYAGGDETQMRHSLRTLCNVIDPATTLYPGHGPSTQLADELRTNAYLHRARAIG